MAGSRTGTRLGLGSGSSGVRFMTGSTAKSKVMAMQRKISANFRLSRIKVRVRVKDSVMVS